jgi:hypothetical protein
VRCKINLCVHFFYVCQEPYEGQNLKLPFILIWYFFWLQIARWFQKCTNFVVRRSTLNVTSWNLSKFGKILKCHIFSPYLTPSDWNWPSNNKICTFLESARHLQPEKVPISIYRATSNFDLHMGIFNPQASELPTDLKKKVCSNSFYI